MNLDYNVIRNKIISVINSCTTHAHLDVAERMVDLYYSQYDDLRGDQIVDDMNFLVRSLQERSLRVHTSNRI